MAANADDIDSRLLTLPPELRNTIYELVFEDNIVDFTAAATRRAPGIAVACKQTYAEATSIYYASSTFLSRDRPEKFASRLRRLQHTASKLIKDIVVDIGALDRAIMSHCEEQRSVFGPVDFMYAARRSQLDVFRLKMYLMRKDRIDLVPKVKGTVVLDHHKPEIVRSSAPWHTFSARFKDSLAFNGAFLHLSKFFDHKHEEPSDCWSLWSYSLISSDPTPMKCDCPPLGDTTAKDSTDEAKEVQIKSG